jgi:hypothetical protein
MLRLQLNQVGGVAMAIKEKAKLRKIGGHLGSPEKPRGYLFGNRGGTEPESFSEQRPVKGPKRKRGPERKK